MTVSAAAAGLDDVVLRWCAEQEGLTASVEGLDVELAEPGLVEKVGMARLTPLAAVLTWGGA